MSRKIANTSWMQLAFSDELALGIYAFHNTLHQVIVVQLVLMIVLLMLLMIPLIRQQLAPEVLRSYSSLRLLRGLTEEEVIAEFLRREFHHPEFKEYRTEFGRLVINPDLSSTRENALRRALLFLRRGPMWRGLPPNTKWLQDRLKACGLQRI